MGPPPFPVERIGLEVPLGTRIINELGVNGDTIPKDGRWMSAETLSISRKVGYEGLYCLSLRCRRHAGETGHLFDGPFGRMNG